MSDFIHNFQYVCLYLITFDTVAVKIRFNGSTSMAPISSILNKILVRKMLFIQNFQTNYLNPFFPIIKSLKNKDTI